MKLSAALFMIEISLMLIACNCDIIMAMDCFESKTKTKLISNRKKRGNNILSNQTEPIWMSPSRGVSLIQAAEENGNENESFNYKLPHTGSGRKGGKAKLAGCLAGWLGWLGHLITGFSASINATWFWRWMTPTFSHFGALKRGLLRLKKRPFGLKSSLIL